jgi:hypothetical protein
MSSDLRFGCLGSLLLCTQGYFSSSFQRKEVGAGLRLSKEGLARLTARLKLLALIPRAQML